MLGKREKVDMRHRVLAISIFAILLVLAFLFVFFNRHSGSNSDSLLPAYLAEPIIIEKQKRERIANAMGFEGVSPVYNEDQIEYELPDAKLVFSLTGRGGFLYHRTDKEENVPDIDIRSIEPTDIARSFLIKHRLFPEESNMGELVGIATGGDNYGDVGFHPSYIPMRVRPSILTVRVSPTKQIHRVNWRWVKLMPVESGRPRSEKEAWALSKLEPNSTRSTTIEYRWAQKDEKLYLVPKYTITTRYEGDHVNLYPRFDDFENGVPKKKEIEVNGKDFPSWRTELQALIMRARKTDRERFRTWDYHKPVRNRGPGYSRHPASMLIDESAQLFIIEKIWKGDWPDLMKNEHLIHILRQPIKGPISLWKEVLDNSNRSDMRSIALNVVAGYNSGKETLLRVMLDKKTTDLEKRAVIWGINCHQPPYAVDLIKNSIEIWNDGSVLSTYTLMTLASLPDEGSRKYLYEITQDKKLPVNTRRGAIQAMGGKPKSGDVDCIKRIMKDSKTEVGVKEAISTILYRYPIEHVRTIIREMLSTSTTDDIVNGALDALDRNGEKEDFAMLELLRNQGTLQKWIREKASAVGARLKSRSK